MFNGSSYEVSNNILSGYEVSNDILSVMYNPALLI